MARMRCLLSFSLIRRLLLCLVWIGLTQPAAVAQEPKEAKHVLVLYSLEAIAPVQEEVNQGLRAVLQANKLHPVKIETEFLDLERFAEAAYRDELLSILRRKYSHRHLDIIIPIFHPAVKFLLKYGDLVFPGVPVVFAAELQPFLQDLTIRSNMTGAYAAPEIAANLKMALGLSPQTRNVVVVGGVSGPNRIYQSWVREAFAPFADRVAVTYLTDHTLEELQERLAHLPPHSIIFFITFDKDPTGREFLSAEVVRLLAKAANAPIFGFYETLLGEGIVGGSLISFQEQGRLAGELAARILNGEKPENLPPVLGPNPFLFDWRELKRWGISEDKLPPGSTVRYREQTLWELYRGWIIGTLVLLGLQSGLIGALLINQVRRRRAEQGLAERLRFEEALSGLSAAFINFSETQVEQEIGAWLSRILEILKVDRISVLEFSDDEEQVQTIHSSTAPGIPDLPGNIPTEALPWFFRNIAEGRTLLYSHLPGDLPAEAVREKEFTRQEELKSSISLPLQAGGRVLGVISFSTLREHVDWSDYPVPRLSLVAEIFANALIRQRAAESLQEAQQNYRIVADFTYDWEYWKNLDGSLRYVSPSCERISGYRPEDLIRRPDLFREIIVPEDRDLWDAHNCDVLEKPGARDCQFRVQLSDGTIRWIEHVCQPVTDSAGMFIGIRASNRDITKRKQGELEIERLKEQLQADYSYLQEEIKLTHDFEHIIGNSNELKYVLHKVEQVAPSVTTVLILGETGTGKELIARAIHSSSPRRDRPVIKVDCASLSSTLIESELFGHEKGAFTGAQSRKIGRFELAHGSTIFLDEIGELPLELQIKLLRVVQEGEFERLGSSKPMKVDVRIIAATNRDLEKEVRKGRFREDLWYRLNVFPITVPPLRQRQEDIPLLVKFFVHRFNRKMGKEVTKIPPEVMESLCRYPWPGNVRELENVIERAIIDTKGSVFQLPAKIGSTQLPASPSSSDESLEAVERSHILQVLEQVGWKIEGEDGAAARLAINPSTLRSRMRKLNIARNH